MTRRYIAHRFGRAYGPDNSRKALRGALSKPLYGIETDCALTIDGRLALLHETYLPHGTTLTGWAHERTFAEITQGRLLDQHGRVSDEQPLELEDLLADPPSVELIQLEAKATVDEELGVRTATAICERLRGVTAPTYELISFWPAAAEVAASHGVPSRLIIACAYLPDSLAQWCVDTGVTGIILEAHYFSPTPVDTLREAGLSITSGLANEAWLVRKVLEYGPDALSTDRPHEIEAELRAGAD
jgi:glycerophosphoryl diester phosphodiesterase